MQMRVPGFTVYICTLQNKVISIKLCHWLFRSFRLVFGIIGQNFVTKIDHVCAVNSILASQSSVIEILHKILNTIYSIYLCKDKEWDIVREKSILVKPKGRNILKIKISNSGQATMHKRLVSFLFFLTEQFW